MPGAHPPTPVSGDHIMKTIDFIDRDAGQAGFVAVRVEGGVVGLTMSLRDDGDMEVFLDRGGQ
jgi:hypothetical protein